MLTVLSVDEALAKVLASVSFRTAVEEVPLLEAAGRVLAEPVVALEDLPAFARSAMDGFAVRAQDTFGAAEAMPALLQVAGEVAMGGAPARPLCPGQAMRIATGGMLPEGADAVVMVEYTELLGSDTVAVYRAAAPGENTIRRGEDLKAGVVALEAGRILRPQDIGALAALGRQAVLVSVRPQVAVISTGDELVPPENIPGPGQVRDVNSYLLAALVQEAGAVPLLFGIVPDREDKLHQALSEASGCDCVVLSGGSSAGARDLTTAAIGRLGRPGVLFHGVSMRPGKPLIFGVVEGRPYFGLSGNPTSALVGFVLFVRPLLFALSGAREERIRLFARVERSLSSAGGREDYFRAFIYARDGELWARPILGQANLISTALRGNALLRIPQDSEGVETGEKVEVILF
jgi:molybdopterin molybdotransferase